MTSASWQFYIDRGGTFTDIVAQTPQGKIIVHKLLSENPSQYEDAPIQGIRDLLGISRDEPIPTEQIAAVKMGTTVATNALLERKGDRTVLLITKGFKDALRIGYQNRPDIFARQIVLPSMLYEAVVEIDARHDTAGNELKAIEPAGIKRDLQEIHARGIRGCAIVLDARLPLSPTRVAGCRNCPTSWLRSGFAFPSGKPPNEVSQSGRYYRSRCLSYADFTALRRSCCPSATRHPTDVYEIRRWTGSCQRFSG